MILKEKQLTNPSDPRLRAGEDAEKQMAFYLQREFRKRDDCFVINDLRVIHDGDIAQIDHLVVSIYGLSIVESKSIHGTISINKHGDWRRTYINEASGIPSPVIQAQAQGKVLLEMLKENAEQILGKFLFGKLQKGFGYCPVSVYVAISDTGIIERGMEVPELFKADVVASAIAKQLEEYKSKASLLSPKNLFSTEFVWEITKQEAKATAEFLISQHMPPSQASRAAQAEPKQILVEHKVESTFVRAGAQCPVCGKEKLIQKSISRSDGTETDFLACQSYPNICKGIFPQVAILPVAKQEIRGVEPLMIAEGSPCPKCGTGKLVIRKGKNGKSDFYGCSNYGKSKCNFTNPIILKSA